MESYLPYQGRIVASADGTYSATLSGPKNITDVAQAQVSDSSILNFGLATGIPKENQTWELYNYTIRYVRQWLECMKFLGSFPRNNDSKVHQD